MEFAVLGRLEVRIDGEAAPLGGPKQRALLALLLLNANGVVSRDRLIDALWGEQAPESAQRSLDSYVSRLRTLLGADRIERHPPGYLLRVAPEELDLEQFEQLLEQGRLVTLSGAGGSGKTRLAQEVAARLLPKFSDGVWLAELAAFRDGALVGPAVASALSVPLPAERSAAEAVADWIGERRMLVVLDNCEHLVAACAALVEELLGACLGLVVMTTSREPLRARGELRFRVPPLGLPDPDSTPDLELLRSYESVQLFRERARLEEPRGPHARSSPRRRGRSSRRCARRIRPVQARRLR